MRARLLGRLRDGRTAAAAIAAVAVATVGTALVFQHGFGYLPCKLCLQQRLPYYAAIPLALLLAAAPPQRRWLAVGLGLVGLIFLVSAALGAYHAGVESGFWPGPNDCGGASPPAPGGMGDFMRQLETTRVVSCTEAAWRFLGLSMAGWNALISLGLAGLALLASRSAAGGLAQHHRPAPGARP
jgi:disulfide bond formation protein DsbB